MLAESWERAMAVANSLRRVPRQGIGTGGATSDRSAEVRIGRLLLGTAAGSWCNRQDLEVESGHAGQQGGKG